MMGQDAATVLTTLALYGAIVVSPGPSFALVSRMSVAGERRAAIGAALGLAMGATVYAVLTMTGLAAVLARVGWLARALQVTGGAYLIYLGVRTWLDASVLLRVTVGHGDTSGLATGARRGFLMCLSNPKAIVFFVGLYAAAIPLGTALWAKSAILAGAFALEVAWYGTVALILSGRHVRRLYERGRKPFERMMGVVLAAFGVRLLLSKA